MLKEHLLGGALERAESAIWAPARVGEERMGLHCKELKAQCQGWEGRASEGPRPSRNPAPSGEGSRGKPWLGPGAGVGNTGSAGPLRGLSQG